MNSQEQTPRLLDRVRNVMRLHHYSIHTERSYTDWIKRYIHFHHMRRREDLANGESKIVTGSAYSDRAGPGNYYLSLFALPAAKRKTSGIALGCNAEYGPQ